MNRIQVQQPITLLAPARDIEVGKAAIRAGADAVYIGAPMYGARQAAGNSVEDIAELVKYAHLYGCQVLVTLNTLLHDDEYTPACALAHQLYNVGVDALIIQDLHLLECDMPPIRLHASTQCDNRTPEQVLALQTMGFRRAVLARELSISEIQAIHEAVVQARPDDPIELEAFVHGALCVSYSGRCFMSEVLMNRSANRGCCAQMCRMRYDLLDADGHELLDDHGQPIHQRYILSLQDMDRSQSLREMIAAGVTTFKIEGRLKDSDYVTNVVAYYRQLLDTIIGKQTESQTYTYSFTPDPRKTFHRGQTDYFLHGRTRPMANWLTPKSTGEPIGKVVYANRNVLGVELLPTITLHNGDGLCFGDQGFAVNGVMSSPQKDSSHNIVEVRPNQMPHITVGTSLFRNQDVDFLHNLHAERHIPVIITFADTSEGYLLTMYPAHGQTDTSLGSITIPAEHQSAQNPTRSLTTIREQLSRLGDTPYTAQRVIVYHQDIECTDTYPYFLPQSLLNEYRRRLVQVTLEQATEIQNVAYSHTPAPDYTQPTAQDHPLMTCRYCILYEMGHCRKQNPMHIEPRYLRLQNGTKVSLTFDCAHCQMIITQQ